MASADFTIADVLAWARTKPADERYVYDDTENCALCQFLRETGRAVTPHVYSDPMWQDGAHGKEHSYPRTLNSASMGSGGFRSEPTFGELVEQLEARVRSRVSA